MRRNGFRQNQANVSDDGTVSGINEDGFESEDKMYLHLTQSDYSEAPCPHLFGAAPDYSSCRTPLPTAGGLQFPKDRKGRIYSG